MHCPFVVATARRHPSYRARQACLAPAFASLVVGVRDQAFGLPHLSLLGGNAISWSSHTGEFDEYLKEAGEWIYEEAYSKDYLSDNSSGEVKPPAMYNGVAVASNEQLAKSWQTNLGPICKTEGNIFFKGLKPVRRPIYGLDHALRQAIMIPYIVKAYKEAHDFEGNMFRPGQEDAHILMMQLAVLFDPGGRESELHAKDSEEEACKSLGLTSIFTYKTDDKTNAHWANILRMACYLDLPRTFGSSSSSVTSPQAAREAPREATREARRRKVRVEDKVKSERAKERIAPRLTLRRGGRRRLQTLTRARGPCQILTWVQRARMASIRMKREWRRRKRSRLACGKPSMLVCL